jgi:hypothetical protein
MPFVKGREKTGGRKPKTPNKVPSLVQENIAQILAQKYDDFLATYDMLEPRDKVATYIKLMEFCIPKLTRAQNEISGVNGEPIEFTSIKFIDEQND